MGATSLITAQNSDVNTGSSYTFTLDQCISYAFGNSYQRRILQLSQQQQQETLAQSKQSRLPSVSASLGETASHTGSTSGMTMSGTASVGANMVLYEGGTINNTIKSDEIAVKNSGEQCKQYDNELTINILETFLSVLGNQEKIKYQQSLVNTSIEQMQQGKIEYDHGAIIESDYLMLESQSASDKSDLITTQNALKNDLLSLKNYISMDPSTDLSIIYPDTSTINNMMLLPSEDTFVSTATDILPDLKISDYAVQMAEQNLKIANANYLPSINASAHIGTGHNDFDAFNDQLSQHFDQSVGVSISIPIYSKGTIKSQVAKSKMSLEQAKLDQKQSKITARQSLVKEYQDVMAALVSYRASVIKLYAYKKTFDAYSAQFKLGKITAVDLLQQQNNYISALNDYIQAKYGFILKRKILDVYMGKTISM